MTEVAIIEGIRSGMMMSIDSQVKNAPYSAEVITETMQNLADGNQISRNCSATDSRFRTFRQLVVIRINDYRISKNGRGSNR